MAKRQDSGSNAAHQDQRPTPHHEDAVQETTDRTRGRADEADEDEFDEEDDELDDDVEADEGEEGSY